MKILAIMALALGMSASAALAGPVTHDQARNIQASIVAENCFGGEMETESNGNVAFEVEDAVCPDGVFDFKLDKDFNILSRTKS